MYEIFSVSYGWPVDKFKEIKENIREDAFMDCGGNTPYCGDGDGEVYIGVDVVAIDCGIVSNRISIDQWNKNIQRELNGIKKQGVASNIGKWRSSIVREADSLVSQNFLSKKARDEFVEYINNTEPFLFWTYSTS